MHDWWETQSPQFVVVAVVVVVVVVVGVMARILQNKKKKKKSLAPGFTGSTLIPPKRGLMCKQFRLCEVSLKCLQIATNQHLLLCEFMFSTSAKPRRQRKKPQTLLILSVSNVTRPRL